MVPVVHPCRKWHGPSCPLWKNLIVPVVHLDITGWSQLSTYVKNGMVPVVHGTNCLAPLNNLSGLLYKFYTNVNIFFKFVLNVHPNRSMYRTKLTLVPALSRTLVGV